jgi:hypothetical protein
MSVFDILTVAVMPEARVNGGGKQRPSLPLMRQGK